MISTRVLWAARIASGLAVVFLLFDGVIKVFNIQPVVDASTHLGLPVDLAVTLGVFELVLAAVYLVPATSVLGAVLWSGYLGGAIAVQARIEEGWFPVLFPAIIALLLWTGPYAKDGRLRQLLPIRR